MIFLEFFQKLFFLFFFLHSIHILFKLWKFTSMCQKIKISKDSRGKNVLMLFSQVDKMRHCVWPSEMTWYKIFNTFSLNDTEDRITREEKKKKEICFLNWTMCSLSSLRNNNIYNAHYFSNSHCSFVIELKCNKWFRFMQNIPKCLYVPWFY